MKAKTGDKTFFLFMAKMFNLDREDKLVLEDHAIVEKAVCITHIVTGRAFTVIRHEHGCEFDYLSITGNAVEQIIDEPVDAAKRAMAFLNQKTDQI